MTLSRLALLSSRHVLLIVGVLALGSIAESQNTAQATRAQAQADADAMHARSATLERQATDYRRAIAACLEGRGYSVR